MENQYSYPPSPKSDLFPEVQLTPASFGERLGAALLDGFLLAFVNGLLSFLLDGEAAELIASAAVSWFYFAGMESSERQATFGKRAMGLQVTDIHGDRLSFGRATARHFGRYLSTLLLLFGYFMMLWDERKQTLHDKLADARVLKVA